MQTTTTLKFVKFAKGLRGTLVLLLCAFMLPGGTACAARTVVLDEPTAPGTVEPPQAAPPAQPYRPYGTSEGNAPRGGGAAQVSCDDFRAAYKKSKSPSIVLFLNRYMSDNLREWESASRIHFSYQAQSSTNQNGNHTDSFGQGQGEASVQHKAEDGSRGALPEAYAWRLEEAIAQPLIGCGVKLVDRAQVMRLAAAKEGPIGQEITSSKYIETQALKGYADLVAQVECGGDGDQQVFRLKVVDVNSGQILVARTIQGNDFGWVATNRGYERETTPAPESVGSSLAQALMTSLTSAW